MHLQYSNQQISRFERNYEPMDLTIKHIRGAIPKRLFARNTDMSMIYRVHDLVMMASIFYGATWVDTSLPSPELKASVWVIYWLVQGTVGLDSFSDYKILNTMVGWILHSALLITYHAWQQSHSKHHKNTGMVTKLVKNVTLTRSQAGLPPLPIYMENPLYSLLVILFLLTIGWPFYLIMNFMSPMISHFWPTPPLFDPVQKMTFFYSNCGIALMVSILAYNSHQFSCWTVIKFYGVPYLIVNGWMICYDYVQHTDPNVPYYRGAIWNFQRGAIATVDRSSGKLIDELHHHMASSHVCHHMFSTKPFYHAVEASPYLKEVLGEYYLEDKSTPIFLRSCIFVEDEGEIVFFKQ
ncbi:MAG: hypothetical protein BYD32DRAFT_443151 [Podila humilis]|nr:MAG: hypothetical protein BYD32DRAFT_443151 [Podila humilis]